MKTPHKQLTLIAQNAEIRGDLEFSGKLRIDGLVTGNILGKADKCELTIGQDGRVEGEIHVGHIIVNGRVDGALHSSNFIQLASKASIRGDVHYQMIEMERGAAVNGSLIHQGSKPHTETTSSEKAEVSNVAGLL